MNGLLKTGVTAALVVAAMGVHAKTIANWKFDNVKGKNTIADSAGKHNGTIQGCKDVKAFIQETDNGKAANFNGTKEQVVVKHDKALDLTNDFTIECDFKPTKTDYYRTILWKGDRSKKPEQISYYVSIGKGRLELKFKDDKGNWHVYGSHKKVEADKWYKAKINYKDGIVTMTVNDQPWYKGKKKITSLFKNKGDLYLGCGAAGKNRAYPFAGLIKEIKITDNTK